MFSLLLELLKTHSEALAESAVNTVLPGVTPEQENGPQSKLSYGTAHTKLSVSKI
jgi:hypothetical protein